MSGRNDFLKTLSRYKIIEIKKNKLFDRISMIRLLVFFTGAGVVTALFKTGYKAFGITLLGAFLTLFVFLIIKHNRVEDELKRIRCKIDIIQKYLDRIDGKWIRFVDSGEGFIDSNHPYTGDLDIFGSKSLFQWVNVSNTFYGRKILKEFLAYPEKDIHLIKERQNAVKELAEKFDFSQELQCEGMMAGGIGNNPEILLAYAENRSKIFNRDWVIKLFYLIPGVTVTTIILAALGFPISPYIPLSMVLLQLVMTAIGYKKVSKILGNVDWFKQNFESFGNLIRLIEKENFNDSYLSQLKSNLFFQSKPASRQIKGLEKIVDAIDLRYSAILYVILNFILLWDYHCVFALEKWKGQYGKSMRNWLETVGHFEAISSLAVVLRLNPTWCFPEFINKELKFAAVELGHPLITGEKRVCNDITIKNNLCVITGSNMSGKTTLLRTIGINLVLAYAGAPVSAKRFECSIMDIFTSMRVVDDLNSGVSTFYAELLRIKLIVDNSSKKEAMIFLIDELFRGTNSRDRIVGAKNVLKNLNKEWVIGLISTHDFELCDLENERNTSIKNYHFTEQYVNNEIKFDYKLRPGRCNTTNARYLMKMVGIELVD
ncbi:MAG: MutS-related protein [Thermincolia bacterium]